MAPIVPTWTGHPAVWGGEAASSGHLEAGKEQGTGQGRHGWHGMAPATARHGVAWRGHGQVPTSRHLEYIAPSIQVTYCIYIGGSYSAPWCLSFP